VKVSSGKLSVRILGVFASLLVFAASLAVPARAKNAGKGETASPSKKSMPPVYLEGTVVTRAEELASDIGAGPHAVEVADGLLIHDGVRNKSIGVEICYPKSQGQFPVVIFSHGSIASGRDYRLFGAYWASHGYVSVLPTHDDAVALHMAPGSKISVMKLAKLAKVTPETLTKRQQDISVAIDSLASLPEKVPALAGKIDASNIAIAGHHAGAFAAEALAGASIGKTNKDKSADSRIKAVIGITGKDWRQPDLVSDDLNRVQLPMMLISFSIDGKSLEDSRGRIFKAMEKAPAGNKFVVTADVIGEVEKPSLATIRKAVKSSNIEIVPFHPFRHIKGLFGKNAPKPKGSTPQENVQVGGVADSERMGGSVLESLGLASLLPEKGDRTGLHFVMSFTLPFLDGYLKNDAAALDRLAAEDGRTFNDTIAAKVERY